MSEQQSPHWSFWSILVIALLWNAMGVINFLFQLDPNNVASMPESHQAIIEVRPPWALIGFAVAVFGGLLGCLLGLFRKSSAFYLFLISLLGVIVQLIPHINLIGTVIHDPIEIGLMIAMPVIVAFFLVWFSRSAIAKNWLR